jgi:hypothetical protein
MGLPVKPGDRVRTALGWDGTLVGFVELSDGTSRAAVQLDEPTPAGPGTNFYPPFLLTVIGDLDEREHDDPGDDQPAGADAGSAD